MLLIRATVPELDRDDLPKLSRVLRSQSKIISVEFPGSPRLEAADRYLKAGDENAILQAISALVSGDSESDLEARAAETFRVVTVMLIDAHSGPTNVHLGRVPFCGVFQELSATVGDRALKHKLHSEQ
jgi:hypothetical protein